MGIFCFSLCLKEPDWGFPLGKWVERGLYAVLSLSGRGTLHAGDSRFFRYPFWMRLEAKAHFTEWHV